MNIPDDKIATWQAVSSYVGEVFSKEEAMKQFLGMTPEEMEAAKQDLNNMSIEEMRKGVNPQTEDYANGERLPKVEVTFILKGPNVSSTDPLAQRVYQGARFKARKGTHYLKKECAVGDELYLGDVFRGTKEGDMAKGHMWEDDDARNLWKDLKANGFKEYTPDFP
jgi:hypothetical protein